MITLIVAVFELDEQPFDVMSQRIEIPLYPVGAGFMVIAFVLSLVIPALPVTGSHDAPFKYFH